MRSKTVVIQNKEGLHARPASLIMQCASDFLADVELIVNNECVNAKSIMSLISVSAVKGSQVIIRTHGEDEVEAEEALVALFNSKFGEE